MNRCSVWSTWVYVGVSTKKANRSRARWPATENPSVTSDRLVGVESVLPIRRPWKSIRRSRLTWKMHFWDWPPRARRSTKFWEVGVRQWGNEDLFRLCVTSTATLSRRNVLERLAGASTRLEISWSVRSLSSRERASAVSKNVDYLSLDS